jgi:hypothetical protein
MNEIPTFYEFVDVLRARLFAADALKRAELHDFADLMRREDYADLIPDNWYDDAFDELKTQGHLDPASGKAMGPTMHGRLSADGRAYVRWQQEQEDDVPEEEDD